MLETIHKETKNENSKEYGKTITPTEMRINRIKKKKTSKGKNLVAGVVACWPPTWIESVLVLLIMMIVMMMIVRMMIVIIMIVLLLLIMMIAMMMVSKLLPIRVDALTKNDEDARLLTLLTLLCPPVTYLRITGQIHVPAC